MLQYCFVQLSIFAFAVCYARSFIFILFGSLFLTFALGVPSRIHTQKVSLPRNSSHRSAEVLLSSRVMDFIMVMSMFCGHLHRRISSSLFFVFLFVWFSLSTRQSCTLQWLSAFRLVLLMCWLLRIRFPMMPYWLMHWLGDLSIYHWLYLQWFIFISVHLLLI